MFRQEKDLCETCKFYIRDEAECPYHYIDDDYDATIECDEYEESED